jgi:ubiquinone/menaquinone biosynthesis C-methylase UbiE
MIQKIKNILISKIQPQGIKFFHREFGQKPFRLLDVGSGNHSATFFSKHFPACEYYGIDITRHYNNNDEDFSHMKGFWEMDLTKLQFDSIPDEYFDAMHMSHVIEHLHNGDAVLDGLLRKIKKGGVFYIECPRFVSTKFPSMRETLNFFDDDTHVRIYSLRELYNTVLRNGFRPLKGGVRRNWVTIFLMPLQVPRMKLKRGYLVGADFWDLLGFAQFIFSKKV